MRYKYYLILSAIALVLSFIFSWVKGFYTYSFINALFTIGYIYVICGFFLYADERGFFNYAKYSLKKISLMINRKRDVGAPKENLQQMMRKRQEKLGITIPFLITGILLVVITFIISLLLIEKL